MKRKPIAQKGFDYRSIKAGDAVQLRYFVSEISGAIKRHVDVVIEVGELLTGAQKLLAHYKTGTFHIWLEAEFNLGKSSAYNYMRAFREFGYCRQREFIEPTAMYRLAGNEAAKAEALRLADDGQRITGAVANELIAQAKSGSDEPPDQGPSRDGTDRVEMDSDERFEEQVSSGKGVETDAAADLGAERTDQALEPDSPPVSCFDRFREIWQTANTFEQAAIRGFVLSCTPVETSG